MAVSCPPPPLYQVCSGGPLMIFYTDEEKKARRDSPPAAFAFQIQHGWQPLLQSTAFCFSRVVCQAPDVPVVISSAVNVVLQGKGIQIFIPASCNVVQENGCKVEERSLPNSEIPRHRVVNIFGASLGRFGDRMEAWISDGMKVFCEGGQQVTCQTGSQTTVSHCELATVARSASSTDTNSKSQK